MLKGSSKGVRAVVALLVIGIVICIVIFIVKNKPTSPTETFIQRWLVNSNGTIATYVLPDEEFDTDIAKGRETLSEPLGLWMRYAIEKGDRKLFEKAHQTLEAYFMENDGFIHWKLNQLGTSQVYTNALIDDLRIMEALYQAEEKWGGGYERTAEKIGRFLAEHNINQSILTDYYDRQYGYSGGSLTLSYIDPEAIELMREMFDVETVIKTIGILRDAPLKKGFYPKSYRELTYRFDEEVHMVDQALVAYHQAKIGVVSKDFLRFVKKEMTERGIIHGRYRLETGEPTVLYESPSVYGFLLMYSLEIEETALAETLYKRMTAFRNDDENSPHYGGYSVDSNGNTHIFDNLVPLLAETVYKRQKN